MNRKTYSALFALLLLAACGPKWQETEADGFKLIHQKGGETLGYASAPILTVDRYAFKDLNRNGALDPYEDWRLPAETRAKDLAAQLSIEEIAGLMLYSGHQSVPGSAYGFGGATYGGKTYPESGAKPYDLTDQQRQFLTEDNLRAVLVTSVESPEVAARWNNNVQALTESLGHGIPANNSSDPRNETAATAEFNMGAGGKISLWPTPLGLAATFDPALVKRFGEVASEEYRALGIATALSPQIDLATEPRWSRFNGTFGEDPDLDTDMARAYVDGFQTTPGTKDGWGLNSVNAMVKHWPSGGPEEGGRDAHFNYGKYAVYPGGRFEDHLKAFTEGAFRLDGDTQKAAAVMPYYTISYGIDPSGDNVGNSYSKYIITTLLREKYGYDGVVCTDWGITKDNAAVESFDGKCWGVEGLTEAERHYEVIKAGVDQFGGNNDKGPVLKAYQMYVRDFGEEAARARFEASAVRLLLNSFRTGLFENPYLDPAASAETVGKPEFMQAGYEAQLKSVVMVKNHDNVLPHWSDRYETTENDCNRVKAKVFVPQRYYPQMPGMFGLSMGAPSHWDYPVDKALVEKYFEWAETPEEADFALVMVQEPQAGSGYDVNDRKKGGNGYVPISLQYRPYKAVHARDASVAGGDPKEDFTNRTYKGKTVTTYNEEDLDLVIRTRKQMGGKPVVVVVNVTRPVVLSELEPYADAILVTFGVQNQAVLDLVSGAVEPSGLLPMQLPADMRTVEEQREDVPHDMRPLVDADGHAWDFAYGLDWNGVIEDARTARYRR
ncbi:MAG: glycoside hydrolase family 3 C-terminal domain-containing protein [Bacteroidales bacterium]|nr:glycoside hydrolase family 3 C-terminal domain-containing protein [Bacteroidales bacterium]